MIYLLHLGIERRQIRATAWVRSLTATFTAAALALILLTLSQTSSYAVDLDAFVGFGQSTSSGSLYRPETTTPLMVFLSGAGIKGDGQLQVIVRSNERTTTYTRKVSLTDGAIKETRSEGFVFQLEPTGYRIGRYANNTEINVQLLIDGRQAAHKTVALPLSTPPESYNLLALTRNGSGLNQLQTKKMGLFHRHTNAEMYINAALPSGNASRNGINPNASLYVAYSRPETLPVMEQGYDMMDAVALADMPLDNLTDAQMAALKGYVCSGGLLIVSGGGDLSRLKAPFYRDLLPITVSGTTTVSDLTALSNRFGTPVRFGAPISLVTGKLKPNAVVLFQESPQMPLVTSRGYGSGTVLLTAFDYLDPSLLGWQAAPSFWRDLLRCGNNAVSPRSVLASAISNDSNVEELADALAGSRASNTPGFWTIASFLGGYIVLLIPVSYFVLKKMDKRELAWYTAPALIASFTLISYLIAVSIKGGNMNVNRAVVLESQAGSDQFAGYSLMTLYSPRRSNYNINLGDSGAAESAEHEVVPNEMFGSLNMGSGITIEQNASTTLRNVAIGLWDKRSFELPISTTLGGAIDASVLMTGGNNAKVTVSNHTRFTIMDCSIIDSDRNVVIGNLSPGQSREVPIKLAFGANADSINLPILADQSLPLTSDLKLETPEAVRAKLRAAIIKGMGPSGQNGNGSSFGYGEVETDFGTVPNTIVGWIDGNLSHPTVDGITPHGEEVDLVCVHLPSPKGAPKAIAVGFNPFLAKPVLNLEDDLGPTGGINGRAMMRAPE